jgi:hypothetical protein
LKSADTVPASTSWLVNFIHSAGLEPRVVGINRRWSGSIHLHLKTTPNQLSWYDRLIGGRGVIFPGSYRHSNSNTTSRNAHITQVVRDHSGDRIEMLLNGFQLRWEEEG